MSAIHNNDGSNTEFTENETDTLSFKKSWILDEVSRDRTCCEVKWTIFCNTAASYRREQLLRPFPPMFMDSVNNKDFGALIEACRNMPSLRNLAMVHLTPAQTELLFWLFRKRFSLRLLSHDQVDAVFGVSLKNICQSPMFVFEVLQPSSADDRFRSLCSGHNIIRAFHGSRIENFYGILCNGLVSRMNKVSAFGEGTYLSTEPSVSLNWSPSSSQAFGQNALGAERLSCIAVCDVIEDMRGLKYSSKPGNSFESTFRNTVPEKYIVVQNDSLVKLKYLLVLTEKPSRVPVQRLLQLPVSSFSTMMVHETKNQKKQRRDFFDVLTKLHYLPCSIRTNTM